MLIRFGYVHLVVGVCLLCLLLPVLWRRKRSLSYLLFFSLFWMYLLALVAVVIFPFAINTPSASSGFLPRINLVPFRFDACARDRYCAIDLLSNILLTIPFGFGMNFLVKLKPRSLFWLAFVPGTVFELSQWVISFVFRSRFRSVDINDVLLNACGLFLGYALFRIFAWTYARLAQALGIRRMGIFGAVYDIAVQAGAREAPRIP